MRKRWDAHADVLSKMMMDPTIHFEDDDRLDASLKRLKEGGVQWQTFAIYIPQSWRGRPFDAVLESADTFKRCIASRPDMLPVRTRADLDALLQPGETRIGAMLALEGADGLEGSFTYLRTAHELGIRSLGLTWNDANWAADGIREARGGGLTNKGRQLVTECDRLGLPMDVSHLSERAFWELLDLSAHPPVASHSNAQSLCNHPRNLSDDQIGALIAANGRIGITFVPYFLRSDGRQATVDDVLRHLDHVCALGGAAFVGFGSDFDGIDVRVNGLEHAGRYGALDEALQKHYTERQVEGFLRKNWLSYYYSRFA